MVTHLTPGKQACFCPRTVQPSQARSNKATPSRRNPNDLACSQEYSATHPQCKSGWVLQKKGYTVKRRIRINLLLVTGLLAACTHFILDTRLGVHFALDVLSEIGSPEELVASASSGPLRLSAELEPERRVALPTVIQQPSGIKHRNGRVYVCTDQTEVFELDPGFKNPSTAVELVGGPLLFKQGALEGIEIRSGTLLAVGELGAVLAWEKQPSNGQWVKVDADSLSRTGASTEFSGLVDTPEGLIAVSETRTELINLDTGSRNVIHFGSFQKEGARLGSLAFSGIAHGDGYLFVLSEEHTMVLVVDPVSYNVENVFGLDPCPASDLSYHDGSIYVVIDHNYNEPTKPVQVYDVQGAISSVSESD